MHTQKDVIASRCATAGGVIAALACMYFLAPLMLPEVATTPVTLAHVALVWLGAIIGRVFWFIFTHMIAWLIMSSDDYYFFRRWFAGID